MDESKFQSYYIRRKKHLEGIINTGGDIKNKANAVLQSDARETIVDSMIRKNPYKHKEKELKTKEEFFREKEG